MEAVHRWFYFSSTASVWLYERVFTRSVHQPLVYAFGAPTTCLRQAYEQREITEAKWISSEDNPADAMTKAKLY